MNYKHLGQNIQTVRKLKGMKQQELADAIGINLQSHYLFQRFKSRIIHTSFNLGKDNGGVRSCTE